MTHTVLDVQNLDVKLKRGTGYTTLVENVSFSVREGECLGILGESGSGKSVAWKAFMRLLDWSGGRFEVSGRAIFDGIDLTSASRAAMKRIRGAKIGVILQNPMTCFDPLHRIGYQMAETMSEHLKPRRGEIKEKCLETLDLMRLKNPEDVLEKYPHQLSGGMLQRVMIGMALIMKPDLIIADEPTTALDAITQFGIIEEFKRIKSLYRTAMIFISHDIGAVSKLADEVVIMHNAAVRRRGTMRDIIEHPDDPYTRFLMETKMAVIDRFISVTREKALEVAS